MRMNSNQFYSFKLTHWVEGLTVIMQLQSILWNIAKSFGHVEQLRNAVRTSYFVDDTYNNINCYFLVLLLMTFVVYTLLATLKYNKFALCH